MKRRWALVLGMTLFAVGLVLGSTRTLPTAQLGRMKDSLAGLDPANAGQGAVVLGQADRQLAGNADVVMVGDSITQFGRWNELFPGLAIANRGIAGDTVAGLLQRVDIIRAANADTTLLMIGINDITAGREPDTIARDYEKLAIALKPGTELFIQSTLPCASFRCDRWTLSAVAQLNTRLVAIAKQQGIGYIDVAHDLAPDGVLPRALSDDGVHLNGEGYQRWSKVIAPHLQSATKNSAQNSTNRL